VVRGFFDPPEARDATEKGWLARLGGNAVAFTPMRLTLMSLLLVTLPVTAGFSFMFAPVLLPSTALVAYAFWHLGRRVSQPGAMIAYCFAAGTFAGVLNSWVTLMFWGMFFDGNVFRYLDPETFGVGTLLGAAVGLAYGTAYLLPMLVQLSARALRRTEAVDRCLMCFGVWGMLVLSLGLAFAYAYQHPIESTLEVVFVITLASAGAHASMFVFGLIRWARRKSWLARVARGKVPGWRIYEQQRFQRAELERLEVFCSPLRSSEALDGFRVLARSTLSGAPDAYRATPLTPKFLVA